MRAAVIDESTNEVVNVIELERDAKWEPPKGFRLAFEEEIPEDATEVDISEATPDIGKVYYEKKFKQPA